MVQLAGRSAFAGASVALVIMGFYALRVAWVVTRGRRWYQLKQL